MSRDSTNHKITRKNVDRFYSSEDPTLSNTCKAVMIEYSSIPELELIPHARWIRDEAWKLHHYPCIGWFGFLDFSISLHPVYTRVLDDVKRGAALVDLGCCLGQHIRKLVHDGAPQSNLTGSELDARFIDLGYQLFCDRDRLQVRFASGDFFAPGTAGLMERYYDYVHAGSFFHLFSWDLQVEAISKCVSLLKPRAGSMIFGRQAGARVAGAVQDTYTDYAQRGMAYRHDQASFARLVGEVERRTGTELDCESEFLEQPRRPDENMPRARDSSRLHHSFSITIKRSNTKG